MEFIETFSSHFQFSQLHNFMENFIRTERKLFLTAQMSVENERDIFLRIYLTKLDLEPKFRILFFS